MTEAIIFGGNDNYHLEAALANAREDKQADFTQAMDKYGVILMMQQTSENELNDLSSDLPTDTHLVRYINPEGDLLGVEAGLGERRHGLTSLEPCQGELGAACEFSQGVETAFHDFRSSTLF